MEELIKVLSGNELTAAQINQIGRDVKEKFGLSDKATDELKMLLLCSGRKFQDYVFEKTYK